MTISLENLNQLDYEAGRPILGKVLEICVNFRVFVVPGFHSSHDFRLNDLLVLVNHDLQSELLVASVRCLGHFNHVICRILILLHHTSKMLGTVFGNTFDRALVYLVAILQ